MNNNCSKKRTWKRLLAFALAAVLVVPNTPLTSKLGVGTMDVWAQQAAAPTNVSKTDCTTISNNDGRITDVDTTMEYQLSGAETWTDITGTTVTGLSAGTYNIRVKASGEDTASDSVSVTINKCALSTLGQVTIAGDAKYNETLEAELLKEQTDVLETDGANVTYSWTRGQEEVGTEKTYQIGTEDIGSTLSVTIACDNLDITSEASINAATATTDVIAKADGPAAPQGLDYTVTQSNNSVIWTITGLSSENTYDFSTNSNFEGEATFSAYNVTGVTSQQIDVTGAATVYVRESETATTKAGSAATVALSAIEVSFNLNGHGTSTPAFQVIKPNTAPVEPQAPQAEGYTFAGWFIEAGCESQYEFDSNLTVNTELFAKWISLTGQGTVSLSIADNVAVYGKTVTASYSGGLDAQVTGDLTYNWYRSGIDTPIQSSTSNTYTLGADDIGKTIYCAVTAANIAGSVSSEPTDTIVKKNYDGAALNSNDFTVTSARWSINESECTTGSIYFPQGQIYEYVYVNDDGDFSSENYPDNSFETVNPNGGEITIYHDYYEEGENSLVGNSYWVRVKATATTNASTPVKVSVPYAYKVSFNMNGHGDSIDPIFVDEGKALPDSVLSPTAEGWSFGGWYESNNCQESTKWNNDSDTINQVKVFYAKWTADELNGASVSIAPAGGNEAGFVYGFPLEATITPGNATGRWSVEWVYANSQNGKAITGEGKTVLATDTGNNNQLTYIYIPTVQDVGKYVTCIVSNSDQTGAISYTAVVTQTNNNQKIKPIELTPDVYVDDKVYDGTAAVMINGVIDPDDVLDGDDVYLKASSIKGNATSQYVGTGISVSAANEAVFELAGIDAAGYTIAQPTGMTVNITPATPVIVTKNLTAKITGSNPAQAELNYEALCSAVSGVIAGTNLNFSILQTAESGISNTGTLDGTGSDQKFTSTQVGSNLIKVTVEAKDAGGTSDPEYTAVDADANENAYTFIIYVAGADERAQTIAMQLDNADVTEGSTITKTFGDAVATITATASVEGGLVQENEQNIPAGTVGDFRSSNPAVVGVTEEGKLSFVGVGESVITMTVPAVSNSQYNVVYSQCMSSFTVKVNPKEIAIPDLKTYENGRVYKVEDSTPVTYYGVDPETLTSNSSYYTEVSEGSVVSVNSAADAGDYSTILRLKDKNNTVWSDGTVEDKRLDWSISKAYQDAPVLATGDTPGIAGVMPDTRYSSGSITGLSGNVEIYRSSVLDAGNKLSVNIASGTAQVDPGKTYYVRYAGDNNHYPSPAVAVSVPAFEGYEICIVLKNENLDNAGTYCSGLARQIPAAWVNDDNWVISEVYSGYTLVKPDPQCISGYEVSGWKRTTEGYGGNATNIGDNDWPLTISANTWIYPVITPVNYTITLDPDEGTVSDNEWSWDSLNGVYTKTYTIEEEYNITLPADPTKEHYDFGGWLADGATEYTEEIEAGTIGNREFTAIWIPETYTITYAGLEGSSFTTTNPNPSSYYYGQSIELINPTKAFHAFAGWYEGTEAGYEALSDEQKAEALHTTVVMNNGSDDKVYTAIWTELTYGIEYDLQGGTISGEAHPGTYKNSEGYTINDRPTRTGYDFVGWYGSGIAEAQPAMSIEVSAGATFGDKSYTAKWTPTEYTVTLDPDDGTISDTAWTAGNDVYTKSYTIETTTFTLPIPSKDNYDFVGWKVSGAEDSSATPLVEVAKGSTADKSYTAVFSARPLAGQATISIDTQNNAVTFENDYVYGQQLKATVAGSNADDLVYHWYHADDTGFQSALNTESSLTYKLKSTDIGKAIIFRATSPTLTTGAIVSDKTTVIGVRPLKLANETFTATTREYDAGIRTATITIIGDESFAEGYVVGEDSVSLTSGNISGTYDNEYANASANPKSITVAPGAITLAGTNASNYQLDLTNVVFTGTISPKSQALSSTGITVNKGGTLTKTQLEAAVSGALGRTLNFVAKSEGGYPTSGTLDESGTYTAPAEGEEDYLYVWASQLDINDDGISDIGGVSSETPFMITITLNDLQAQTLTFMEGETVVTGNVVKIMTSDHPFSIVATSDVDGGTIAYSSSNTNVATVASDGAVTLVGIGTTTITATVTAIEGYNAASNSYTLVVDQILITPDKIPVVSNPTYDGTEKTGVSVANGATGYSLSGDIAQTAAGTYTATATLLPGYVWMPNYTLYSETDNQITIDTSNNTYPLTLKWSIAKRDNTHTTAFTATPVAATYGTSNGKITIAATDSQTTITENTLEYTSIANASDSDWTTLSSLTISDLSAGTYYVRYKADDVNTNPGDTVTVTVPTAYTVKFVTSKGTAPEDQTVESGATASTPELTVTGFTVEGWYDAPEGGNKWNFESAITENKTFYAHWTAASIGISYVEEVNNELVELETTNPSSYTKEMSAFTLVNPTKEGYVFTGWTATGGMTISVAQKSVTVDPSILNGVSPITFTAVWQARATAPTAKLLTNPAPEEGDPTEISGTVFTGESALVELISGLDSGAVIYYTTDGSEPTKASAIITGRIAITGTTTIKAFASENDKADSEVVTFTFTKDSGSSGGGGGGGTTTEVPITGLTLTPATANVVKGKTVTLTAAFVPADATEQATITWNSSDNTVATVANGVVTGVKAGTANITASVTAQGGTFTKTCAVTVTEEKPITGITVNPTTAKVLKDKTATITALITPADANEEATVTWTSSDTTVATVAADTTAAGTAATGITGLTATVTGVKKGTATITAKVVAKGGTFTATCAVTVSDEIIAVTGITVTPATATVDMNKTVTLTAAFTPEEQTENPEIVWSSSNDAIATVSGSGLTATVTGIRAGKATITATVTTETDTFTASASIEVKKVAVPIIGIQLSATELTIREGEIALLEAQILPENHTEEANVVWTIADKKIVSLKNQRVTGLKEGTTTITASVAGEKETFTATCTVTVKGHSNNLNVKVENFDENTKMGKVTVTCPVCGKTLYSGTLAGTENADGSYKFTFTVDNETYSVDWFNHEHDWGAPTWTWTDSPAASAKFECAVGKEIRDVNALIQVIRENSLGTRLIQAFVTGPDNLTYTDSKWFDKDGKITTEPGIGIEGLEAEYEYTGKPIKPAFTVVDYALDKVLVEGTDYSVSYKDNKKVGTATITVKGKNNYGEKGGEIVKTFKIVDPTAEEKPEDYFTVKSVKVASKDGFTYDGTEKYPATLAIKTSEGDVTATWDGSEYTLNVDSTKELKIVVTDNIKKGSGVVAVYGNNGKGAFVTKTATFSIKACDLSTAGEKLTVTANSAVWAVKGAKAAVEVEFNGETLVEGRDYTLSWSYTNKKNVGEKAGKVAVKGKNNFTKKAEQTFDITPFEISKVDQVAVYAGLAPKGIKVTLYDNEGTVIPAKLYTVKVEKDGSDVTTSKVKLNAGESVDVTATAASPNLDGDETLADITVAADLAKAKVVVPKGFTKTFTGEPIELTNEDFGSGKITVGSYKYGTDFIVVAYQNNVKKGTMTAFIQGISDKCTGIGKIKVKIVPQKIKKMSDQT